MTWLGRLPHQIPFRAASGVIERGDAHIVGSFVWTANDELPPDVMVMEAMAQFAGGIALEAQGFLTGIDHCEIVRPIEAGDLIRVEVRLEASFGGTHRFSGIATCGGVEIAHGRFYLASGAPGE